MEKDTNIKELVLGGEDNVRFVSNAKLIALIEKCAAIDEEYLESQRGFLFSDAWYKRAIDAQLKLCTLVEPYVEHSLLHLHEAIMLEEKVPSAAVGDMHTLDLPAVDLGHVYRFALSQLVSFYGDLSDEVERARTWKRFTTYADKYWKMYLKQQKIEQTATKKAAARKK